MNKKRNTFLYLMWHDLIAQSGILLFCLIIIFLVKAGMKECSATITDVIFLMLPGFIWSQAFLSNMEQDSFFTFHFSRKRFYRYQVFLSIIRAAQLAVVRSGYQYAMQKEFIYEFLEDTDATISMYHSVSLAELFVTNICIFTVINLWYLFLNTLTVNFYFIKIEGVNGGYSPQLRLRIDCQKERHPKGYLVFAVILKLVSFISMIGVCMLIIFYYQMEMQAALFVRMLVLACMVMVCGILYLIGKKRYCPEYI